MSWSLKLGKHGDLETEGASLGQVTGGSKLVQDLKCAILEKRGTDDMHRGFGSLIDGGYDDRGNWIESIIGEADWDFAILRIKSELMRIMTEYQQKQIARSGNDRSLYGLSTLTPDEFLERILDIQFYRAEYNPDALLAVVSIQTANQSNINISVPIQTTGLGI